ncbi:MAG TPA: hypothetical protein VGE74_02545 [Gemmata sp.]
MARGDPVRVRVPVHDGGAHVGYLTTVGYPDRDISAFSGGTPRFDIVVSGLREEHLALLQQYRQHWLIYCGTHYDTTDVAGDLNSEHLLDLTILALRSANDSEPVRVAALKAHVEGVLRGTRKS